MNRGLNFYGIILLTIATILVFTLTDFGVVHATTGIDLDDNPAQFNQVPNLKSDPDDNEESTSNNNNNNNNDDTNNDDASNNNNNDDTNNDDQSSTSTSTSTSRTPISTSTSTPTTTSNDNVPMSIPFNSNMADESDDETDYSSIIPFP